MSISIARLFVDREEISDSFEAMIRGRSEKQIMLVEAVGGMGKSWLLGKLKHDSSRQKPPAAYTSTDFKDGQLHDFLSIVRSARDDFGAAHFNELTRVINQATQYQVTLDLPPASSGPVRAEFRDVVHSEVNVAGGHIIKDNFFSLQLPSESLRADVERRISRAFFQALGEYLRGQGAVFFFDSYERATESSQKWIENRLLYEIREGRLAGAVVVIAGRQVPQVDSTWKPSTTRPRLAELSGQDVQTYLQDKLGLTPDKADAETLYRASQGNPQLLGMLADNVLMTFGADEDW